MEVFIAVLLFLLGFVLVIFGGNFFVDAAVRIAKRFKMSEILIGATIVSIGTTLPELLTSSIAAAAGKADMAAGNAIGSIICNTALIAALVQAIRPSNFDYSDFRRGYIIFFAAVAVFAIFAYAMGEINYIAGIILVIMFVFYMVFNVYMARRKQKISDPVPLYAEQNSNMGAEKSQNSLKTSNENVSPKSGDDPSLSNIEDGKKSEEAPSSSSGGIISKFKNSYAESQATHRNLFTFLDFLILFAMAAVLYLGTNLLVNNGTFIAQTLGVSEKIIAVTIIAIGTSLPELVTAISSLIKKHSAVSLGNIIGANTLNILLVAGVSSLIMPLPMDRAWLMIDLPVMAAVSLILALPALITKRLHRWQGFTLLALYIAYTVFTLVG